MKYAKKQVEQYNELKNKNPLFPLILNTFQNLISDTITGNIALDLGCGYGYLTRYLKNWGAKEVLGVDISESMIDLAQKYEEQYPVGVNYMLSSIQELGKINSFDIITAAHLIVNVKDEHDLKIWLDNIVMNCRKYTKLYLIDYCGIFERFNNEVQEKYGFKLEKISSNKNYLLFKLCSSRLDSGEFSVINICFERNYFNSKLRQHGFTNLKWHSIEYASKIVPKELQSTWKNIKNESMPEILEATYIG